MWKSTHCLLNLRDVCTVKFYHFNLAAWTVLAQTAAKLNNNTIIKPSNHPGFCVDWTSFPFFLFALLPPANGVWGKVIFSQACVKNSVERGGGAWSGGGVCSGGWGGLVETPPDGYCCGRYASYWNATCFFLFFSFHLSTWFPYLFPSLISSYLKESSTSRYKLT